MTGFGAGGAAAGGFRVSLDLRSVNGRYLSLKIRMPGEFSSLEEELRGMLEPAIVRGSAEAHVEVRHGATGGKGPIDVGAVEAYVRQWRTLARRLKLPGEIGVDTLAAVPEAFEARVGREDAALAMPALRAAAQQALDRFRTMRRREGAALVGSLAVHLTALDDVRSRLAARAPEALRQLIERAAQRVNRLLETAGPGVTVRPEDLARESAWLAERTDFSEEMDRLSSHIGQFRKALAAGGQLGKRLDFLVQEMHREVNTAGSKAQDTAISSLVVEAKLQVEKLREQVQNLL
jgi:uncharacterized protein (TIGR00255 family)